jgi:hypothetical protein
VDELALPFATRWDVADSFEIYRRESNLAIVICQGGMRGSVVGRTGQVSNRISHSAPNLLLGWKLESGTKLWSVFAHQKGSLLDLRHSKVNCIKSRNVNDVVESRRS